MKKSTIIVAIVFLAVIFSSYEFATSQLEKVKSELQSTREELSRVKSENKKMKSSEMELNSENDLLHKNIEELNSRIQEFKNVPKKVQASQYGIDGTPLFLFKNDYFLDYEGKTYISAEFIKSYYGIKKDYLNDLMIRGLPLEKKLISIKEVYGLSHDDLLKIIDKYNMKKKNYYTYETDGFEIEFADRCDSYTLTKPLFMNERGITIGSSRSDVQRAYGKLGNENAVEWSTFQWNMEYLGTTFTFKDDKVIKIFATIE